MTAVHGTALAVAVIASAYDLRTRRIPNVLTFGATGCALAFHGVTGGWSALGLSLAGWLAGAAVFFVPFALRGLGGGDVKLLAALGAWVGVVDVLWLAAYAGVAGGVLAVLIAAARGYLGHAIRNVWLLLCHWRVAGLSALPEITIEGSSAPKLAYAVPILVGTLVVTCLR